MTIKDQVKNAIARFRGGSSHSYTANTIRAYTDNEEITPDQVKRAIRSMRHIVNNGKGVYTIKGRRTPAK